MIKFLKCLLKRVGALTAKIVNHCPNTENQNNAVNDQHDFI